MPMFFWDQKNKPWLVILSYLSVHMRINMEISIVIASFI